MSAYDKVMLARSKGRPTGAAYIENIFEQFVELHGDRRFADDPAVIGGLALLGNCHNSSCRFRTPCLHGRFPVSLSASIQGGAV